MGHQPGLTYRVAYDGCPLCGGGGSAVRTATSEQRGEIRCELAWVKCDSCGHVHTSHFFNEDGTAALLSSVGALGRFGGNLDEQRFIWGRVIARILPHVKQRGRWIDVGIGNGSFLFTADEFGFDAIGIDIREGVLRPLQKLGYRVEHADAMTYDYTGASVVVLADILEHMPYPKELLKRIREKLTGALFVSCPNMDSVSWRYMDATVGCMFWREPEHYHNFTKARLERLLVECGFKPVDYSISSRYQACMEVIAV